MTARFDKFTWLKALQSDSALTDRDFRLAVLIGITYTRGDGSGWLVELDALAAALPGGLSRRRLVDALRRLAGRGYLVEADRSGGGRGVTARRSFDLDIPMTPASGVSDGRGLWITPETQDASGTGFVETPDASVRNPGQQRPKPLTAASHKVAADLPKQPPTGTPSGTSSGGGPPPTISPTAQDRTQGWTRGPYGPRCLNPEHVNHPDPPGCRGCGDAREAAKAIEADRKAAIRKAIDNCQDCDAAGRLDDLTDCPKHPNFRKAS